MLFGLQVILDVTHYLHNDPKWPKDMMQGWHNKEGWCTDGSRWCYFFFSLFLPCPLCIWHGVDFIFHFINFLLIPSHFVQNARVALFSLLFILQVVVLVVLILNIFICLCHKLSVQGRLQQCACTRVEKIAYQASAVFSTYWRTLTYASPLFWIYGVWGLNITWAFIITLVTSKYGLSRDCCNTQCPLFMSYVQHPRHSHSFFTDYNSYSSELWTLP